MILSKDKKVIFNLSYIYATDGVDNLDRNTSFSQLDASLKFYLLDKKLQVSLIGNDILKTNQPEYIGLSNNVVTSFKNYSDIRSIKLSLVYDLGRDLKIKEQEGKNDAEKERI